MNATFLVTITELWVLFWKNIDIHDISPPWNRTDVPFFQSSKQFRFKLYSQATTCTRYLFPVQKTEQCFELVFICSLWRPAVDFFNGRSQQSAEEFEGAGWCRNTLGGLSLLQWKGTRIRYRIQTSCNKSQNFSIFKEVLFNIIHQTIKYINLIKMFNTWHNNLYLV